MLQDPTYQTLLLHAVRSPEGHRSSAELCHQWISATGVAHIKQMCGGAAHRAAHRVNRCLLVPLQREAAAEQALKEAEEKRKRDEEAAEQARLVAERTAALQV